MAALTVQAITRTGTGLQPAYTAAAGGGDTVRVGKSVFLHIKNDGGSAVTVTVATPGKAYGLDISDLAIAIPAGEERMIGPIDDAFRGSNGSASISYSGVTSVTLAALRVG